MVIGAIELLPIVDAAGEFGELAELYPEFDDWESGADLCPPEIFVSRWRASWPTTVEVPPAGTPSRWREAIDHVTSSWDFGSTAFFRLDGPVLYR